jgi:hypothetical protein
MRLDLEAVVPDPSPLPDGIETRAVTRDDAEALAVLMDDAYRGTIDAEPGQDLDDARSEIAATFAGAYGTPMLEASVVAVEQDELVSASIVTRFEGSPFVAFTMTRASRKGRGLSRAVMTRTVRILAGPARRISTSSSRRATSRRRGCPRRSGSTRSRRSRAERTCSRLDRGSTTLAARWTTPS